MESVRDGFISGVTTNNYMQNHIYCIDPVHIEYVVRAK